MPGNLVLVTGVTGFIAGQVVESLLKAGYRVRGTARGSKADVLINTVHVPGLEFVRVDDIATSDLDAVLEDVHAAIHVASPLPGHASMEETLSTAIDGTLNVLRKGSHRGIKKFVITSTFGTLVDPLLVDGFSDRTLSETDWNNVTLEDIKTNSHNPYYVYFGAKTLAEKAAWEFAASNPEVDLATILPGFVYGPYAPPLPLPSNSTNLGTNGFIYALLSGGKPPLAPPWVVDVRDVARAHVLALELPPVPTPTVTPTLDSSTLSGSGSDQPERDRDIQSKRIIINAGNYTWPEAIAFLKQHPGLEDKVKEGLTDPEAFGELPGPPSRLDNTRAREMLNMEFIAPEKTIEETVRVMLQLEASWAPTT